MTTYFRSALALAAAIAAIAAGAAGAAWFARAPAHPPAAAATAQAAAFERAILYYRDPSGAPVWSATPRKDAQGRDFLPVYDDEEISFDPKPAAPKAAQGVAPGARKILYYRNPMGLPDTSPVPKKDSMGMDYIAVYAGEDDDSGAVKISLGRVQRAGVRTEAVEQRVIVRPVRGIGTVKIDETRQTIVTTRSDGYVEDLFVARTGQHVKAGEPLFRVYSPDIQRAQIDLISAMRALPRGIAGADAERALDGAMQRLRNLGVPEARIEEVRRTGQNPRTIDWPAPAAGNVVEKRIVNGQRIIAGSELYRIVDLSQVWVIAEVAEGDLDGIAIGTGADITFRAYPKQPVVGAVSFIYPELRPETRTVRVRIEVPNADGRLRADMYADVAFRAGAGNAPVASVPASAVIDSGTRQVVLVVKGEGRFEPRPVKLGRRGGGHVEVVDGLTAGEEVVTAATFLIDAESNLRAALKSFAQPEAAK